MNQSELNVSYPTLILINIISLEYNNAYKVKIIDYHKG